MTELQLSDATPDRRAYQVLGNGKAEWAWRIVGALVSVALAWGTVQREQAKLEERERNHYGELTRALADMKADLKQEMRDLREDIKESRR